MSAVKAISRFLSGVETSLIVLLLGTMTGLAFLQVILRNFFSTGILWADPFLRHLVLWVGFLGASQATRQEKHINLDILTRYTSGRMRNTFRIFTNIFAGMITALLARAGWIFLKSELDSAETIFAIGRTNVPAWWFQIIIPVGFGLMAFRFFIRASEHVVELFHPTPTVEPPTNVPTLET